MTNDTTLSAARQKKWKLMYEGPDLGYLLGFPVFVEPFLGSNTDLARYSGFQYHNYLWYSDPDELGGLHGGYYDADELIEVGIYGKRNFSSAAWLFRWYWLIDYYSFFVTRFIKAHPPDVPPSRTEAAKLLPRMLLRQRKLLSLLRCSQPQLTDPLKAALYACLEGISDTNEREEAFLKLTMPEKPSFFTYEEMGWLDILIDAKRTIPHEDASSITEAALAEKYPQFLARIRTHYERYRLVPASERSQAWDLPHFIELLKTSLASDIDFEEKRAHLRALYADSRTIKRTIIRKYALPSQALHLGSRIAKVGYYRFKSGFHWRWMGYGISRMCDAYAPEFELTYGEMCALTFEEFQDTLASGKLAVAKPVLREWAKASLYVRVDDRDYILRGEEARKMRHEILDAEEAEISEMKGEIGSRGTATGTAFVFHWSDDIVKKMRDMPKGAILVAPQTHPIYMPAIRLAAALVCDEGGVTGHAAIVSRELKKPCIIGLHTATKVIRTGDTVEVDANTGIVRILRRAGM